MRGLEFGAHAELSGLGDSRAAAQYRDLVHLVLTAAETRGVPGQSTEQARARREQLSRNLRRYALFVRVSLENLIEYGQSLDARKPAIPRIDQPQGDQALWSPEHTPQAWLDALQREPGDPQFKPAK